MGFQGFAFVLFSFVCVGNEIDVTKLNYSRLGFCKTKQRFGQKKERRQLGLVFFLLKGKIAWRVGVTHICFIKLKCLHSFFLKN